MSGPSLLRPLINSTWFLLMFLQVLHFSQANVHKGYFRVTAAELNLGIGAYLVRSEVDCADRCARDPVCKGFCHRPQRRAERVWMKMEYGECYLDRQTGSAPAFPVPNAAALSCFKDCRRDQNYKLIAGQCTKVVAEQKRKGDCPSSKGYKRKDGRCIKLTTWGPKAASWSNARDSCALDGGKLLVLKTAGDLTLLEKWMKEEDSTNTFAWVGAQDMDEDGKYLWLNGAELPDDSPMWHDAEPSGDRMPEERCVQVWAANGEVYKLNDAKCAAKFPFACEIIIGPVAVF